MMRFFLRSSFAVAALAAASFSCLHAQTFTGKAKAVADADKAWSVAAHAGDLDKVMDFLAPDAVVFAPGAPMAATREQITAIYKSVLSIPGIDFSWTLMHAEAAGDLAYTDGTYSMSYKGPDGKPVVDTGKYISVWHLDKSGQWKVIRDIFNSDLPGAH